MEITPVTDARTLHDFVALPGRLHRDGTYDQDSRRERLLLEGSHPLSATFAVRGLVAYAHGRPVGRIGLTTYPRDPTGYVGFYDCPDDPTVAAALFDAVGDLAAEQGCSVQVGPVDASFWLRYRLKVSGFDEKPYVAEPVNPPYQVAQWRQAAFGEVARYRSAYYHRTPKDLVVERFAQRSRQFSGYDIRAASDLDWSVALEYLHRLLHELYSDFPAFHPVDLDAFRRTFGDMRWAADLDVSCFAFLGGEPKAFLVALPDYGVGLSSRSTVRRIQALLTAKVTRSRYVLPYLGTTVPGLGSALMQRFTTQMAARRAEVVGALSQVGKASEGYGSAYLRARSEYVLLAREC